jgi:cell wall-associated NlpC family hydrolase
VRGDRLRLTKGIRFFVSLTLLLSLLLSFGCGPKKIRVYESTPVPQVKGDIVQYAVTLLGRPYKSAAKGPDYFDCSGLVHYVYKRFDITLPSSTEGLSKIGHEISYGDVAVGDLVMFRIKREGHVGIMINRLEFIHASRSRGVAIDSVDAGYWKKYFSHFRRVF